MNTLLELQDINKNIKNKVILKNINLKIERGKIYGFIGHNGSGKSMLFSLIVGLILPSNGVIKWSDTDISIGASIENPSFLEEYSGLQNLKLLAGINNNISVEKIREVLVRVGLDPNKKEGVKSYSLGMKQKLAIAQAIMENPDILILDEPTNGLDEGSVNNIRKLIKEENESGKTILITSHNKEDIEILCNEVFKMENGSIIKV